MDIIPKYRIGTTIAIEKQNVLSYFEKHIDCKNENETRESYTCKDGSILVLLPSDIASKVFVRFDLNLFNPIDESVSFIGKIWFMNFCKENNSMIKNLRTGLVMPVSDGAVTSDIFHSKAFRVSLHLANNPKDKQNKRTNK